MPIVSDDIVFWVRAAKKNAKTEIERKLNEALSTLARWCEENNMLVNPAKTAVQTYSLMHQNMIPEIYFHGCRLENKDKCTYLRLVFDNKLSWRFQVDSIIKKIGKRLNIL